MYPEGRGGKRWNKVAQQLVQLYIDTPSNQKFMEQFIKSHLVWWEDYLISAIFWISLEKSRTEFGV